MNQSSTTNSPINSMTMRNGSIVFEMEEIHSAVRNIFSSTKCYDLMQASSKATVFETTISFQLAFFALIEHDADVAPLWDLERKVFCGLMTITDYIKAIRIWRANNLPTTELTSLTIRDMLHSSQYQFRHTGFMGVDAEDSVSQMCSLLLRTGNDYVPIMDPDNGNLVSILGYLDIIHLLDQAAKQHPQLFSMCLQDSQVGTVREVPTAPKNAKLHNVLDFMGSRGLAAIPVVDETGKVIGIYHNSDVSFIIRAADPDAVINNLSNYTIEESLALKEQLLQSGEITSVFEGLVLSKLSDPMSSVLSNLMMSRATRSVIVDDAGRCYGMFSIRDLVQYYFE